MHSRTTTLAFGVVKIWGMAEFQERIFSSNSIGILEAVPGDLLSHRTIFRTNNPSPQKGTRQQVL